MNRFSSTIAALALAVSLAPLSAQAASDHREFVGRVVHVSSDNIKVTGVEGGKQQTLSFLLAPHFGKLFGKDAKTVRQVADIRAGDKVKIVYDQKLLGIRHADQIIDYSFTDAPMHN